ncbi:MAG: peptidase M50 [Gammaproteobacteria bacterium]
MTEAVFSQLWYRVADVRPRLRRETAFVAHEYRGQTWHVLKDRSSARSHRFAPSAHHFIRLMDGTRTVDEVWRLTEERFGDDAPTQDQAIELLAQLHRADLLRVDNGKVPPAIDELLQRHQSGKSRAWKQRLASPLSLRIPLLDPNAFLDRTIERVRPLLTRAGFFVWLVTVASAAALAATRWPELSEFAIDQVMTPRNLLLLWLCYPLVKLAHELGHAYAAKHWGCEVHEVGIMLLVLVPMPYVDASASAALPDARHRALIAAMGIIVETFIASIALFVWLLVEPGAVRTVAFSLMLIGGVSTLLFNGNPLLRFDGYYVLADMLGIPNLASRSKQYFGYLVRRYLFGVTGATSPVISSGERGWLAGYAVTSFVYRMALMFTIILYVASRFFVVGFLLAAWAVITQLLVPLLRQLQALASDPELERRRARVLSTAGGIAIAVTIALFILPAPLTTHTEGVVWAPGESELRAEADAIVDKLVVEPNTRVDAGDALLVTSDPELAARVDILDADRREAVARYNSLRSIEQVEAGIVLDEIRAIEAELARAREQLASLIVRSPANGVFLVDRPQDLVGRYLRQGDLIGFVADLSSATVRVAVTQANIGLIRTRTERVDVRFSERIEETRAATINREVPSASNRIPSAALGIAGGGRLAVKREDERGTATLEDVFHIELDVDRPIERIGGRMYVRFDHGTEPLGRQWYRRLRQLLLSQFDA